MQGTTDGPLPGEIITMYTTLDFLKKNSACKPGYTEMIQFFGVSRKLTHVPLPLGLCSMVLKKNNFEWMLEFALMVDEEMYKAFRRKWLVPFCQWYANEVLDMPNAGGDRKEARVYIQQMRDIETYEQAEAFIQMVSFVSVNGFSLFDDEVDHWFGDNCPDPWHIPAHFVRAVVKHFDVTWSYDRHREHNRKAPADKQLEHKPYYFGWPRGNGAAAPMLANLFSEDPYKEAIKFLSEHPEISRSVLKSKLSFVNDKPQMTFTLEDPKRIFNAYRMLADSKEQATGALADVLAEETRVTEYANSDDEEEED